MELLSDELKDEITVFAKKEVLRLLSTKKPKDTEPVEFMLDKIGKTGNVWFSKEKESDMWYCNLGDGSGGITNACTGLDARRAVTNLYLYCLEKGLFTE